MWSTATALFMTSDCCLDVGIASYDVGFVCVCPPFDVGCKLCRRIAALTLELPP